jgi:hypothetical protein
MVFKMKRFKQFLNEAFFNSVKNPNAKNANTEIFVNPTSSELKDFTSVRWIAFPKTKNIYVSDSDLLHVDLARAAYKKEPKGIRIHGDGSRRAGGKLNLYFNETDVLYPSDDGYFMDNYYLGVEFYDYDWEFMNKWIPSFTSDIPSKENVIKAKQEYDDAEMGDGD